MTMTRQLTVEQEAYYLYLVEHYNTVVILANNEMYGVDSLADGLRMLEAERDYQRMEHGTT